MKRAAGIMKLALAALVLVGGEAVAQKKPKKAPAKKTNTNRKPTPAPAVVEEAPLPVVNLIDSAAYRDSIARAGMIPKATPSMRPGTTVVGDDFLVQGKPPLPYDHLRIDDVVYKQILWKDLFLNERINSTFRYAAENDFGSQNFFYILLGHIRDGDITAFDAVNDRFTTPLTIGDVASSMGAKQNSYQVPDYVNDPDGSKGLLRDTIVTEEFDINSIIGYRIKEEVIFDRETSRMHFRTLGIAPLINKEIAGQRASMPMFWVYYPDARPFLTRHAAYNPRNMAMQMSWDEIFESRFYNGVIFKSTMSNNNDLPLRAIIKDPLLRLYEGETIKNSIFNWEQDQWSY